MGITDGGSSVKLVNDGVCVKCRRDIIGSFRQHHFILPKMMPLYHSLIDILITTMLFFRSKCACYGQEVSSCMYIILKSADC
jgi:hypothetical protein